MPVYAALCLLFTAIISSRFFHFEYFSLFSLCLSLVQFMSHICHANPQGASINHDRIMQKYKWGEKQTEKIGKNKLDKHLSQSGR